MMRKTQTVLMMRRKIDQQQLLLLLSPFLALLGLAALLVPKTKTTILSWKCAMPRTMSRKELTRMTMT